VKKQNKKNEAIDFQFAEGRKEEQKGDLAENFFKAIPDINSA